LFAVVDIANIQQCFAYTSIKAKIISIKKDPGGSVLGWGLAYAINPLAVIAQSIVAQ
jgi:hypothetical protein